MMKNALSLFLLACLLVGGECFPSGAPASACDTVAPNPAAQGGHGAQPQGTPAPYTLSGLPTNGNYTPGMTYTLTLSGSNSEMFRGFLAVTIDGAGQRVGSFAAAANSQTTCTDSRGITHTSRSDKTTVSFTWMAPSVGTGEVEVRFAVVRVLATYWANQLAATLQEAQPEPSTSPDMPSPSPFPDMPSPSTSPDMPSPSTSPDMPSPSPFPDMPSPSPSPAAGGGTTSAASPSPTSPPGGGNSVPSNVAGSLATILLAAIAFVMVAAFV